jgi:hypothetical protein
MAEYFLLQHLSENCKNILVVIGCVYAYPPEGASDVSRIRWVESQRDSKYWTPGANTGCPEQILDARSEY